MLKTTTSQHNNLENLLVPQKAVLKLYKERKLREILKKIINRRITNAYANLQLLSWPPLMLVRPGAYFNNIIVVEPLTIKTVLIRFGNILDLRWQLPNHLGIVPATPDSLAYHVRS